MNGYGCYDYDRAIRMRAMPALVISDLTEAHHTLSLGSRLHSLARVLSAVDPCVAMSISLAVIEAHDAWVAKDVKARGPECRAYLDLCDLAAGAQLAATAFYLRRQASTYYGRYSRTEAGA